MTFCCLFLRLLLCQMDQQIGYKEYRIILVLTDIDLYKGTVFFHDHTVDCQWNGHPLVLLHHRNNGCQISESAILIQGILLYIQSGAVDMGSRMFMPSVMGLRPIWNMAMVCSSIRCIPYLRF